MTSWAKKRLDEVADLCLGKMLDAAKNKGEELPYLANVNVRWGTFDLDDLRLMRFEPGERERYGLRHGDIVMCEGGEPGRCAIWKDAVPGMMIQKALHRIRAHDGVDQRFLYYSFLHMGVTDGFSHLFTGATIKHLPGQNLAKLEVALPCLDVQRAVADRLSDIDDLIDNNRRRIKLLEDSVRLLFDEWFVRLQFPGHEASTIIDGMPAGWSKVALDQVLLLQRGFDLPSQDREAGDVPIYGSTGIVGLHNKAKVTGPGLVTGRSGSLGEVHFVAQDFWPLNTALWVKEFKRATPLFALHLLRGMRLEQYNGGVSVPTLDRKVVHKAEVLLPDAAIMERFESVADDVYRQINTLTAMSEKLRTARDLLLPRLMSGELAV